jgi:hypothetical protein
VQTVQLSCTNTNIVSKQTETRYHMTHITKEFHRVRPKWFLSLWDIQCKPCTDLASRLALSLNRPKRASSWATSPRCTIGWSKMISLAQTVQLSCTNTRTISECIEMRLHMSHVTQEDHRVRPKQFIRLWYVWCKPCTYLPPKLTPSLNGLKRDSTWPPSPRSSIGCVQNDFWAYGTFDVNRVPILRQD